MHVFHYRLNRFRSDKSLAYTVAAYQLFRHFLDRMDFWYQLFSLGCRKQ